MSLYNVDALTSGTLIDAGVAAGDIAAIDEGIVILERLVSATPEARGDIQYCLANGLSSKADFDATEYPEWYLITADIRQRARRFYQSSASNNLTPIGIRSQAYTNLGNSLLRGFRLVEAYDCYTSALKYDPTNSIALIGASRVLLRLARIGAGDSNVLLSVADKYLIKAKENPERIRQLAGEKAYQFLSKFLGTDIPTGELPDLVAATDYQRFVAKHRLTLAPTIEGLDLSTSRWDSLHVHGITEHISAGQGVPPLFAMLNILKSEYLAARYLAYLALNSTLPETGKYHDTLDYANYGIKESILTLAQRTCLDVLDKVAVAASEYLRLPGEPSNIYFTNRWFVNPKLGESLAWQPQIREAILRGNTALIAISEVSLDIKAGGFLQDKKMLRNSSTHRFTVLHDLGGFSSRSSNYVDHHSFDEFVNQLIETLQLARAVILYFVEMVTQNEHLVEDEGVFKGQLFVPDHDWVRGEEV
ncbi:MAG: LA2681 family HEPN domain-containing protein [Firmicutes bacterium]|nr:LA2681 family HEPN domain-containing protein [Bacillota bacterium]